MAELVICDKQDLVNIADELRTLKGTTASMTVGELDAGLSETNAAVTSALAAIAEKGVDTAGKGLGDIAALVESIQAGGGDTSFQTIVVASDTKSFTLPNPLGELPAMAILIAIPELSATSFDIYLGGNGFLAHVATNVYGYSVYKNANNTIQNQYIVYGSTSFNFNKTYLKVTNSTVTADLTGNGRNFPAGQRYAVILSKIEY